jgi:CBS-domain-containing membrane protein
VKSKKVKDLMIPLAEYATVKEDAELFDAVAALEKAQSKFGKDRYRHRAILVMNAAGQVVGKISQMDVIRSLEPKYSEIGDPRMISRAGFSLQFLKSMLETLGLWQDSLADICQKAKSVKVKEFMYAPTEGEYIDEDASMSQAIHQLVMGQHHSLLVLTGAKKISGILRLTDVFEEVVRSIKACNS